MSNEEPKEGEIYQHFKGPKRKYRIICVSRDCENPERKLVSYESLYRTPELPIGERWSRSLEEFIGFVERDGKRIKRFVRVEE